MQPLAPAVPRSRRRKVRPTITQVAREAGVAIATVSGILNQRADCYAADTTRQRVRDVALRLGYRASLMANALHGRATKTLGLLVPAIGVGEVVIRTMASFESTARNEGFLTVTACTQDDPELEDGVLGELLGRHVDGIAMYPAEQGRHTKLRYLAAEGFPIVTLDGAGRLDFPVDDVSISQYDGGRLQAEHLIQLGCRRVCLINSVQRRYVNDQKVAGLTEALTRAGFPAPLRAELDLAVHTQHHWDVRELDQIREFLRAHRSEFDALVAVGDVLAVSAMRCAIELGVRVPEDLVVIGFNDIVLASEVVPSLSTVHDPAEQMGEAAFRLLSERLRDAGEPRPPRQVKLLPEFMPRESTARFRVSVSL
jgi:DNA-binding LacI/PurR family transcriptional regulator